MNRKRWRKVLYENQGYPDNYTDKNTFLQDLRKNIDYKEVSLYEAVIGASLLVQEFCTVVSVVLVYVYLYNKWIQPEIILSLSGGLTLACFLIYRLIYTHEMFVNVGHDLRTLLIFIVFGQLFSPILHTLTDTISTDSIYTMTFLMMLVHLVFFDYGVNVAIVCNSLSLNASVFASVCLASRLPSAYHTFILMTVVIECFVLFPLLRNKINKPILVTCILIICNSCGLILISYIFTVFFILTILFINVICPILYVKNQKYKENIYGPWDEAIVEDVDSKVFS